MVQAMVPENHKLVRKCTKKPNFELQCAEIPDPENRVHLYLQWVYHKPYRLYPMQVCQLYHATIQIYICISTYMYYHMCLYVRTRTCVLTYICLNLRCILPTARRLWKVLVSQYVRSSVGSVLSLCWMRGELVNAHHQRYSEILVLIEVWTHTSDWKLWTFRTPIEHQCDGRVKTHQPTNPTLFEFCPIGA